MTCRRGALGAIWVVPPIQVRTCGGLLPAYTTGREPCSGSSRDKRSACPWLAIRRSEVVVLMGSDDRLRSDSRYYPHSRTQSCAVQVQSGADGFEPPDTNPDP